MDRLDYRKKRAEMLKEDAVKYEQTMTFKVFDFISLVVTAILLFPITCIILAFNVLRLVYPYLKDLFFMIQHIISCPFHIFTCSGEKYVKFRWRYYLYKKEKGQK